MGGHLKEVLAIYGVGLFLLDDPDDVDLVDESVVWSTQVGEVKANEDGVSFQGELLGSGAYIRELAIALMTASFYHRKSIVEGDEENDF